MKRLEKGLSSESAMKPILLRTEYLKKKDDTFCLVVAVACVFE